ncbi:hypothetical protein [Methylocystis sp.]|uniref:hypothetical protein n=1 Tax=Methylocystis sp. TaxID=1911079 RepID=UPI002734F8EA|nr:hypothetical protein [Methylocystis sp.]MDP3552825.1 hypothetical protein [Methylocystis sp.]
MEWLAFSIACVATIYFAIHYRGFRRGLMFVAGGVIALAAAAAIYFWNDNRQTEARRQIASKLIRLDQIRVLDAKLALGSFAEMSGTIVNRSDFELSGLTIKVVVSDCPRYKANYFDRFDDAQAPEPHGDATAPAQSQDHKAAPNPEHGPWEEYQKEQDGAQCGIVGEGVAHLYSIDVPKGQKRAFETHVTLPKLPEMKKWSWRYSIEGPIAKY